MHSSRGDSAALFFQFGIQLHNVFDTQVGMKIHMLLVVDYIDIQRVYCTLELVGNKRERKPKVQPRMNNTEILITICTQDKDRAKTNQEQHRKIKRIATRTPPKMAKNCKITRRHLELVLKCTYDTLYFRSESFFEGFKIKIVIKL